MYVQQTVVLFKAEKVQEVQSTLEALRGGGGGGQINPLDFSALYICCLTDRQKLWYNWHIFWR